ERQLPLEEKQHAGNEDDREHVLKEKDQPVAEEEAHALKIDGRAGHELTGLVAVVEAEREPDEMRVETLAKVHLDRERLLPGDHPAAEHQDRTNDSQRDDRADLDPQFVRIVARERVVDHVPRY